MCCSVFSTLLDEKAEQKSGGIRNIKQKNDISRNISIIIQYNKIICTYTCILSCFILQLDKHLFTFTAVSKKLQIVYF